MAKENSDRALLSLLTRGHVGRACARGTEFRAGIERDELHRRRLRTVCGGLRAPLAPRFRHTPRDCCRSKSTAGRAPPRRASEQTYGGASALTLSSEESPRAFRQRVPAVKAWAPRCGVRRGLSGLSLPARGSSPWLDSYARRGPSGPLNRTGLTLAVSYTRCQSNGHLCSRRGCRWAACARS